MDDVNFAWQDDWQEMNETRARRPAFWPFHFQFWRTLIREIPVRLPEIGRRGVVNALATANRFFDGATKQANLILCASPHCVCVFKKLDQFFISQPMRKLLVPIWLAEVFFWGDKNGAVNSTFSALNGRLPAKVIPVSLLPLKNCADLIFDQEAS